MEEICGNDVRKSKSSALLWTTTRSEKQRLNTEANGSIGMGLQSRQPFPGHLQKRNRGEGPEKDEQDFNLVTGNSKALNVHQNMCERRKQ